MSDLGAKAGAVDEAARLFDRRSKGDRALVFSGFTLAAAAALFPWFVFFNQDRFDITVMPWDKNRDLPENPAKQINSISPLALTDGDKGSRSAEKLFDPITTATVGNAEDGGLPSDAINASLDQEFPGAPPYQLLHVANGRALIEDRSGMYLIQVGSPLPDNSILEAMVERDGKWVLITSNGDEIGE
ncbi:MAG: flagellar protein [Rhizobiales bacterium]|mgnify:FL=1|nr:flagellar protein [Hyphomicrobiales bacterium]|tara:strand:+ start:206 stop:766 length:561 start_codon:yes stop_codon:yes gene_type:complete